MVLLFTYLMLALGVSFLCSLVEAVILSITRAQVARIVKEGRRFGRLLESLKSDIDRPLAAILTLNTIAHTVGAAGVGAQALLVFGEAWVAVTSAVLTLLILVLSEIIPKTLGAAYNDHLAPVSAVVIKSMIVVTYPMVVIFDRLAGMLSRDRAQIQLTREELVLMAELGRAAGAFDDHEHAIVRSVFALRERNVASVMTPRPDVVWLDLNDPWTENLRRIQEEHHARYPVGRGSLDQPVGIVEWRDLAPTVLSGGVVDLQRLIKPSPVVPESGSVLKLVGQFKGSPVRVALVVDEYGAVVGLVTRTDILESIVGSLPSDDVDAPKAIPRNDGSWLVDGDMPYQDCIEQLNLLDERTIDRPGFQTLAGFVMANLGNIPKTGATFEWNGHQFEVVDMDRHRIDKVLVTPRPLNPTVPQGGSLGMNSN